MNSYLRQWGRWTFILTVVALFFPLHHLANVLRFSENIPVSDDYYLLKYVNQDMVERWHTLFLPCADHRIVVTRLAAITINQISGHLDFRLLTIFGNLGLLGVFVVMLKAWRACELPAYTLPVMSVLLFTPYYWNLRVWAITSVEVIWLHFFAVFAIWCRLYLPGWTGAALAVLSGITAVFTRADGFAVLIVLMLIAIWEALDNYRNDRSASVRAAWEAASLFVLVFLSLFLLFYLPWSRQCPERLGYTFSSIPNIIRYVFILHGGIFRWPGAANSGFIWLSYSAGISFLFLLILMLRSNLRNTARFFFFTALFLYISAGSIAFGRVLEGFAEAQAPRYMLNPLLLLVCYYALLTKSCEGFRKKYLLHCFIFAALTYNYYIWNNHALISCNALMEQWRNERLQIKSGENADPEYPEEKGYDIRLFHKVLNEALNKGNYRQLD